MDFTGTWLASLGRVGLNYDRVHCPRVERLRQLIVRSVTTSHLERHSRSAAFSMFASGPLTLQYSP